MAVLSLVLLFVAIVYGYSNPRNALWFSILLFPVLYPANVVIVPSTVLFLNINRVVLFILLGIYMKTPNRFNFSILMKNGVIKVFFIFSMYIIVISLGDRLKNLIFAFIPNLVIIFLLGYAIIERKVDFKRLIHILTIQSIFFSSIVLLDFFNIANISLIVRKLSPTFNKDFIQEGAERGGIYRVAGWDGDSINSAIRLVVLFPIILLYSELSKKKSLSFIAASLAFISIIVLMSRSAYVGFFISMVYLLTYIFLKIDKNIVIKVSQVLKKGTLILGLLIGIVIFVPFVNNAVVKIYEFSISDKTEKDTEGRINRIPYAIDRFLEKPLFGWGSPQYVYYEVMNTDDAPSFIIYLLAGGIPLFLLFLFWWVKMPFYFLRYLKYPFINKEDRIIYIYVGASMVGGLIPMLSNKNEKSLLLMLIIFIATYKYFLISSSKYRGIKK